MEFHLSTGNTRVTSTDGELEGVMVHLPQRVVTKTGADGDPLHIGTGNRGGKVALTFREGSHALKQLWGAPVDGWSGSVVDSGGQKYRVSGGIRTNRPGFSRDVKFSFAVIS